MYEARQSVKRAYLIVVFLGLIVLILAVAIVYLTPLKTVVPYVIRYDSTTGYTDITTGLTSTDVDINEAVSKYFVSKYIQLREGYYYETLQQDYDLVQQFGANAVNEEYRNIYAGKGARQEVLSNKVMEKIDVISVVLNPASEPQAATVRIKILTYDRAMKGLPIEKNKVVTLTFEYVLDSKMSELYRLNNPLGFRVVTYRVDSEVTR
jgi:type IV secretion system protein VirB8